MGGLQHEPPQVLCPQRQSQRLAGGGRGQGRSFRSTERGPSSRAAPAGLEAEPARHTRGARVPSGTDTLTLQERLAGE